MKWKESKRLICVFLVLSLLCCTSLAASANNGTVRELIPLGKTVGVEIQTGGLLITGLTTVESAKGTFCPARQAGLASGDLITAINGNATRDMETFRKILDSEGFQSVTLSVTRAGIVFQTNVIPVQDSTGMNHIGVLAKDTVEGIGTMTYYDPQEQVFAALGHGISDSGVLLPLWQGKITQASVMAAVKGARGTPGHLEGSFNPGLQLGEITSNTACGIFGSSLSESIFKTGTPIPAAAASQIELGEAVIYANVIGDDVCEYSVEIVKINGMEKDSLKNMEIRVTDPVLLEMTGGIVQGMSGSPIIQNGRLIGAVTHVLVNDPARGYAISIEKMLEAGGETSDLAAQTEWGPGQRPLQTRQHNMTP